MVEITKSMAPTPIALSPALPSELLEYVLTHQVYPTTVLICQPRASFLSSLSKAVKHTPSRALSPPSSPPLRESNVPSNPEPKELSQRHSLVIPTLHQIATSRHINLVFIPTITHLRAYLAVFPGPKAEKEGPPKLGCDKPAREANQGLLVVYGIVGLHRDTSEWSAQGLGNSVAAVVEGGSRSGRKVVLLEETGMDEGNGRVGGEEMVDEEEHQNMTGRSKVWEERVPMLNGSVRRAGLETEDGGWSGRTVEVGRILARWFKFRKGDWDIRETA